ARGGSKPRITERVALVSRELEPSRRIPAIEAGRRYGMLCLDLRRCGWVRDTGPGTVEAPSQVGEADDGAESDRGAGGRSDRRLAFEGTDYEIDLSAKNAAAFHKVLTHYIEHGRKDGRASARRSGRTAASRQRSGDIRA